jgi:hypothetical protein
MSSHVHPLRCKKCGTSFPSRLSVQLTVEEDGVPRLVVYCTRHHGEFVGSFTLLQFPNVVQCKLCAATMADAARVPGDRSAPRLPNPN